MEQKATRLTRRETAEALTAAGYPISPATLSTMATRGGGPRYVRFNGRALYDIEEALQWAASRVEAA
jgi:hypothetical protein